MTRDNPVTLYINDVNSLRHPNLKRCTVSVPQYIERDLNPSLLSHREETEIQLNKDFPGSQQVHKVLLLEMFLSQYSCLSTKKFEFD